MSGIRYIKLILPLQLEWEPCYSTDSSAVRVGDRVGVSFAHRSYIGVVSECDVTPDVEPSRIQPINNVSTGLAPVSAEELALWRFIADYYLCTVGEVYKAAYPYGKTAAEETGARSVRQRQLLERKTEELWRVRIARLRARLEAKDASLARRHREDVLARLKAQRDAILQELAEAESRLNSISKPLSLSQDGSAVLPDNLRDLRPDVPLATTLGAGKPVLLISSDRYSHYVRLAAAQLVRGRNVLILVPETALARELQERMQETFGDLLLVNHSSMTQAQRRRIADAIRSGRQYVLLGTRSAIFLPHRELGLVIVDDEQSPFYKQTDGAPHYNARDCAVQLSLIHGCGVLLGTSSPSLESLLNARTGKYTAIKKAMSGGGSMQIIDIPAERRKNGLVGAFSRKLMQAVKELPEGGKTVYIRGFERREELPEDADVLSIPQAARSDLSGYSLVAMLSADALFDAADFRSDERAFQYIDALRNACPQVIIQTSQSAHQVFRLKDPSPLLEERRNFGLPPYTRLVDVLIAAGQRSAEFADKLSKLLPKQGFNAMPALPAQQGKTRIRVILPKDKKLKDNKLRLRSVVYGLKADLHFGGSVILDVDPA